MLTLNKKAFLIFAHNCNATSYSTSYFDCLETYVIVITNFLYLLLSLPVYTQSICKMWHVNSINFILKISENHFLNSLSFHIKTVNYSISDYSLFLSAWLHDYTSFSLKDETHLSSSSHTIHLLQVIYFTTYILT